MSSSVVTYARAAHRRWLVDPLCGTANFAATTPLAGVDVALAVDTRLVDVNCDGLPDAPFVGGQLLGDRDLLTTWNPRVLSTTLALAWVATGRRAAYITDGRLQGSSFRSWNRTVPGRGLCRDRPRGSSAPQRSWTHRRG